MIYWELSYRAAKEGYPWLTITFSDEKHALSSLRKFWGDEFETLKCKEYSNLNYREWYNEKLPGMDGLVATMCRVEVHPHARSITLPTEEKAA